MPINKDGKTLLTSQELKPLVEVDGIVECINGGLLLGNYHCDGGVTVLREYNNENIYEAVAELEGWEYVMCEDATFHHKEYLHKINDEFDGSSPGFQEYEIPENVMIVDTRPIIPYLKDTNKLLLFGQNSHFIINKFSTKKYLQELDKLNRQYCR